jgi:formate hydrogenlyase subunit 6/NADH:ubiquinone oxidoreductase subunit I
MLINILGFHTYLNKIQQEVINGYSEVIVPTGTKNANGKESYLSKVSNNQQFTLSNYRSVDPLKFLFYFPREKVFPVNGEKKKRIIAGVKSCDLKALNLLDKALSGKDFIDPEYVKWRENTLIISSDCLNIASTCHCTLLNGNPYSDSGFDINLSEISDDYYITSGSSKGDEFIALLKNNIKFREADEQILKKIEAARNSVIEQLKNQNASFVRSDDYTKLRFTIFDLWKEESKECIGCGACTNICPTCYCLILNDESKDKDFIKVRSYDSCQLHGYAKVAGGGSPRPKMYERFRNRYLCKFDYMKHNFDEYSCTGCGRCTDACAAKIDFRKVVSVMQNSISNINSQSVEVK